MARSGAVRFGSVPRPVPAGSGTKRFGSVRFCRFGSVSYSFLKVKHEWPGRNRTSEQQCYGQFYNSPEDRTDFSKMQIGTLGAYSPLGVSFE